MPPGRAFTYFKAGKAAQGLPDAQRALELKPNDPYALSIRGLIFEAPGRREEAITDYRRILSDNPNNEAAKDRLKGLGATP